MMLELYTKFDPFWNKYKGLLGRSWPQSRHLTDNKTAYWSSSEKLVSRQIPQHISLIPQANGEDSISSRLVNMLPMTNDSKYSNHTPLSLSIFKISFYI